MMNSGRKLKKNWKTNERLFCISLILLFILFALELSLAYYPLYIKNKTESGYTHAQKIFILLKKSLHMGLHRLTERIKNPSRIMAVLVFMGLLQVTCMQSGIPFSGSAELGAIECIKITFKEQYLLGEVERYYTIERTNNEYYSDTGQKIDSNVISTITESLTDLYETEKFEVDFCVTDIYPTFTVVVTYSETEAVLKTHSNCHCYIPWNVEYRGNLYVQYNGKIPSAVFKILTELDREEWAHRDKEARWGCFSGDVPEDYAEKGVSPLFPESKKVAEEDRTRVMWRQTLTDFFVGPPLYADGKVFATVGMEIFCFDADTGKEVWSYTGNVKQTVHDEKYIVYINDTLLVTVEDGLLCFDGNTGDQLWEATANVVGPPLVLDERIFVRIDQTPEPYTQPQLAGIRCFDVTTGALLWEYTVEETRKCTVRPSQNMLLHENKIYFGTGEPSLCCLDAESGNIIWKYQDSVSPWLEVSGDTILMIGESGESVTCLSSDTGEKVWEITDIEFGAVYNDKILIREYTPVPNSIPGCTEECDILLDSNSGEPVWAGKISGGQFNTVYDNGVLYFITGGNTLRALDLKTMKEVFNYTYEAIDDIKVFDQGIVLTVNTIEGFTHYVERLLFLDKNGELVWEYHYPDIMYGDIDAVLECNVVFVFRGEGFIDAFDAETGEYLWRTEIRGSEIADAFTLKCNLLITADDAKVYSLDDKGVIAWEVDTGGGLYGDNNKFKPYFFEITENALFVYTEDGTLCAISQRDSVLKSLSVIAATGVILIIVTILFTKHRKAR